MIAEGRRFNPGRRLTAFLQGEVSDFSCTAQSHTLRVHENLQVLVVQADQRFALYWQSSLDIISLALQLEESIGFPEYQESYAFIGKSAASRSFASAAQQNERVLLVAENRPTLEAPVGNHT